MSIRALPDAESVVIDYLLTTDVAALVSDRIYDRAPENVTFPYLIVRRISGTPSTHHWQDHARIELTAWVWRGQNNGSSIAREICEAAVVAMHEMPAAGVTDAIVNHVQDAIGARFIPDPDHSNIRYIAEVLVHLHPAPELS